MWYVLASGGRDGPALTHVASCSDLLIDQHVLWRKPLEPVLQQRRNLMLAWKCRPEMHALLQQGKTMQVHVDGLVLGTHLRASPSEMYWKEISPSCWSMLRRCLLSRLLRALVT